MDKIVILGGQVSPYQIMQALRRQAYQANLRQEEASGTDEATKASETPAETHVAPLTNAPTGYTLVERHPRLDIALYALDDILGIRDETVVEIVIAGGIVIGSNNPRNLFRNIKNVNDNILKGLYNLKSTTTPDQPEAEEIKVAEAPQFDFMACYKKINGINHLYQIVNLTAYREQGYSEDNILSITSTQEGYYGKDNILYGDDKSAFPTRLETTSVS